VDARGQNEEQADEFHTCKGERAGLAEPSSVVSLT